MHKKSYQFDWLIVLPQDKLEGGAEQLLINLVTQFNAENRSCCVVFLKQKIFGDWKHLEDLCNIHYGPSKSVYIGYLSLLPRLIKISLRYDVKRSFTSQTLINAMMGLLKKLGFFRNTKVIVRESNSIFHLLKGIKLKRYTLAYNLGYWGVDLIICQTEFMKKQLLEAIPWMKDKLKLIVLPNPIDLEVIKGKSEVIIPELIGRKYIIAAGRLKPVKGFDLLIRSFHDVLKYYPHLELMILGDGSERKRLQKLIDELSLSNKAHLIGYVNNVYPYFKRSEICVLSSRIEGFPNVLLQMMSQNTKVVSTLSAGGIENLEGVFTCETNNVKSLTNTIIKCLETDTSSFRTLFDQNLKKRTVSYFIESVMSNID